LGLVIGWKFFVPHGWFSLVSTGLGFLLGVWVSGEAEMILGQRDHPSIVIDELVGMMVALSLLPPEPLPLLGAFLLFRLFDIWKPWAIVESLPAGWGIMLDDLVAGLLANLLIRWIIF